MATFIQSRAATTTAINPSLAYTSNVTAGSLLVIAIREGADVAAPTVTDSLGNTWTQAQNANRSTILYTKTTSGGANTVTIANNAAAASCRFSIFEFGGTWSTNPLDVVSAAVSSSAAPPLSTNSVTPTTASDAVLFALLGTVADTSAHTVSSPFTISAVASSRVIPAYAIVSSVTPYTAEYNWSGTSNGARLHLVSFVESGGGGSNAARSRINGALSSPLINGGLIR